MERKIMINKGLKKSLAFLLTLTMIFTILAIPTYSFAEPSSTTESEQIASKALFGDGTTKGAIDYYLQKDEGTLADWWELMAVYGSGADISEFAIPDAPVLTSNSTINNYSEAIFIKLIRGEDARAEATSLAAIQKIDGTFSTATNDQSWAIIALDAYNRENPSPIVYSTEAAINILKSQQFPISGGFAYDPLSWPSEDTNTSGFVAIAIAPYVLVNADVDLVKNNLIKYFKSMKAESGGFKYDSGSTVDDINSDATVIMGLMALGINLNVGYDSGGVTPLQALLAYRLPTGSFAYGLDSRTANLIATKQATIALSDVYKNKSSLLNLKRNLSTYTKSVYVQLESSTSVEVKGNITLKENQETVADAAQIAWARSRKTGSIDHSLYNVFINHDPVPAIWTTSISEGDRLLIIPKEVKYLAGFASTSASIVIGQSITLTLKGILVNGSGDSPISGASITINGSVYGGDYPTLTDVNGKIEITTFNEAGTYIISSSVSQDALGNIFSRPICKITVTSLDAYEKHVSIRVEGIKTSAGVTPFSYIPKFTATSDGSKVITAAEVLRQFSESNGWVVPNISGGFLTKINNFPQSGVHPWDYWMWGLNGLGTSNSIVDYAVKNGDEIVFYFGGYAQYATLSAVNIGDSGGSNDYATLKFTANGWYGMENVTGAYITWNEKIYISDDSGIVTIPAVEIPAGKQNLQIEKYAGNGVASVVRFAPDFKLILSPEITIPSTGTADINSSDLPTTYITNSENPGNLSISTNIIRSGDATIATLPGIAVYSRRDDGTSIIEMNIVPDTKITASTNTWDGIIQLPKVEDIKSITIPNSTVSAVVSVGSPLDSFTFDKPVRLVIPGTAGQRIGYMSGGAVTEITDIVLFDDFDTAVTKLGNGFGSAKIISGNDTIIWTKHFTEFVAYTTSGDSNPNDSITPSVGDRVWMSIDGMKGSKYMMKASYALPLESGKTALDLLTKNVSSALTKNSGYSVYVYSIFGLAEFDGGALSGWLYKVNDKFLGYSADSYILKPNDYIQWIYTKDLGNDVGGNLAGVDIVATGTSIATIEAKVNDTGKATATITKDDLSKLVKDGTNALKVTSNLATLIFDKNAMKTISEQATGEIKIIASKVDITKLSARLQTEIGSRPVFDFTVISGIKTISDFKGKVTVSIPYTPTIDEDVNSLIIYYINDEGNLEIMKNCIYDVLTKTMTFSTDHFSNYAVGYVPSGFNDISGHWSMGNINFLAARGIIQGKSEGFFKPNDTITRAEFVTILGNKFGADFSKYSTSLFGDVKGNDWFAGAVAWASEKGVVIGADGMFRPNDQISRQEMAVILDRYITNLEKTDITGTNKTIAFADNNKIADYAKTSVVKMQQLGIINGKTETNFAPTENATRGEAAKMISVLIKSSL